MTRRNWIWIATILSALSLLTSAQTLQVGTGERVPPRASHGDLPHP